MKSPLQRTAGKLALEYLRSLDFLVSLIAMVVTFAVLAGAAQVISCSLNHLLFGNFSRDPSDIWVFLILLPIIARLTVGAGGFSHPLRPFRKRPSIPDPRQGSQISST